MYHARFSRFTCAALAAALCLSLTACKSTQEPEQSSTSEPPAQSTMAPTQSTVEETPLEKILEVLAQKGLEEYEHFTNPELDELISHTVDGRTLLVLRQTGSPHVAGLNNLVVGIWDEETDSIAGDVFSLRGDDGLRSSWEDQNGLFHILLSNTAINHGYETSTPPKYLVFDGQTLTQVTEVPEGYLYEGDPLPAGWETAILSGDSDFWADLKAVPYPGGMELYTRNPEYDNADPEKSQLRQWLYLGYLALDGVPLPLK